MLAAAGFAEQADDSMLLGVFGILLLLLVWTLTGLLAGIVLQTLAELVVFRTRVCLRQLLFFMCGVATTGLLWLGVS